MDGGTRLPPLNTDIRELSADDGSRASQTATSSDENLEEHGSSLRNLKTHGKLYWLAKKVLWAPAGVFLVAIVLAQLPEKNVEFHIKLDLRGIFLLGVIAFLWLVRIGYINVKIIAASLLTWRAHAEVDHEEHIPPTPRLRSTSLPRGLHAGVLELPEDFLRALITWDTEWLESAVAGLNCPVCSEIMLRPLRTDCQHYACAKCLTDRHSKNDKSCPQCGRQDAGPKDTSARGEFNDQLVGVSVSCAGCKSWHGDFTEFCAHAQMCPAVLGAAAIRQYRLAEEADDRACTSALTATIDALHTDMLGTSPVLLHRFPAETLSKEGYWNTPLFSACGRLWCLRCGSFKGDLEGTRYFCIVPHAHFERLKCSILFARRPGEGYVEKRVHDWPIDKAGQPWGPTLPAEQLQPLKQADGSLLLMVHASGLIVNNEESASSA